MADKTDDKNDEAEKEKIFRTLQDDKNRDTLLGILKPLVESVLTSKLPDIETEIKRSVSREVCDKLKSVEERNIKDLGVSLKRPHDQTVAKDVETSDVSRDTIARSSKKPKLKRAYSSVDDAIAHWRKIANDEWENARRTDLTELKGILTVICLDTSASMSEDKAFEHAKQFLLNYLDTTREMHSEDRAELIALVTFGMETKIKMRLTKDYECLKSEIEQLKPGGPSTMFGGLVLAKAVARTSDCVVMINEAIQVFPKIILITDGKPTAISLIDGEERADEVNVDQTKQIIRDEVKTFTEKNIDLHIVYVGKPDYDFLHSIRDCSGGVMMPYTDGEKMAFHTLHSAHLISRRQKNTVTETPERAEILKSLRQAQEELLKHLGEMVKLPEMPDFSEFIKNMKKADHDPYYVVEDKKLKYPRIGSRVRRGKDWKWGDQDRKGPGTIIGHFHKENSEDRQISVWVEWDEDDKRNIYRYRTYRGTKGDVKLVDEERIPPDDEILAVGMKVGTGPDFEGAQKLRQGVVIRIFDYDDEDGNDDCDDGNEKSSDDDITHEISKAEILWEDSERGKYFFGEKGSKVEIQPTTKFTKPEKPQKIDITEVTDREVFIQWDRPASCGGCGIIKYKVFKKTMKPASEWCEVVEVDSNETKATVSNLEINEMYLFAVLAENKMGPGDLMETSKAVKLKISICKPEPPLGPLDIKHVTKSSCTVYWKESSVCEKKPVTHYIVEFHEAGKSSWERVDAENKTSHKLTQLRRSTTYELRVKSVNKTGVSEPLGIESFVTKNFLDSDIPCVKLQDKHLVELSTALAGDWQLLGHYLGLNNVAIDCVVSDDKSSGVTMWIFKMLSIWRQRNPDTADFYRLIEGIEAVITLKVDWDKISEVARKIKDAA